MYREHYVTELDKAEEKQLLENLRRAKNQNSSTSYSVLVISPGDPAAKLARSLECKVFSEFTFDRPITEIMREEYTLYDDHCFFLIAVSWKHSQVVGVMRIVNAKPGTDGLSALRQLKSLQDIENPDEPWGLDLAKIIESSRLASMLSAKIWDIATLAVHPEFRRKANVGVAISFSLYHELYMLSQFNEVDYWVAILDEKVLDLVQKLGRPFHLYRGVETKFYVGAPSTPVYCHIKTAVRRLRWKNYLLYRQLIKGHILRRTTHFEEVTGL